MIMGNHAAFVSVWETAVGSRKDRPGIQVHGNWLDIRLTNCEFDCCFWVSDDRYAILGWLLLMRWHLMEIIVYLCFFRRENFRGTI